MKKVITIIYFTDNAGKARTIEFSLKSLVSLAIVLSILMIALMAFAVFSLKFYAEKNKLANELVSVNAEKNSAEEKIKEMEARTNKREDIANKPAVPTISPQTKGDNAAAEKGAGAPVALRGFQVKKDGKGLKIGFDLVNANNDKSLNGYVFIVGDYGGTYFCFPQNVDIKDGAPVDFKKGDRFYIKWQKHMEQAFPVSIGNTIKTVSVFVFSADGALLAKKEELI